MFINLFTYYYFSYIIKNNNIYIGDIMINSNDIKYLSSKLSFWPHISEKEKNLLINSTISYSYNKNSNIHSKNNDCVGVVIIKKGCLRVYIISEDGKEITLYRLYENDVCILSASCILKNITFDVNIDIEEDSEILLINSTIFSKLSAQNIYVENFALKSAADKFSDVMWTMNQILFMSFDKRLAIFLYEEMIKDSSNTINLTHNQIAKYIGSAREVVTRMLKYFASEGIVELSRGKIIIINKNKLKNIINE